MNGRSFVFAGVMISIGLLSNGGIMGASLTESTTMKTEIEVKFFVNKNDFEQRLHLLGGAVATPRRLMRRQLFAFPVTLRKPNLEQQARVRDEGDRITMTLKESTIPRTMSSVQELEIIINNFDAAVQIFMMSGYEPTTYQENYRTSWIYEGCCVEIDEWPGLRSFAEIEAPSEAELKRVAALLNIELTSFMSCSLFDLYEQELKLDAKKMRRLARLTFENFELVTKGF